MAQSWNADAYAKNGRFVADLAADLVTLLDPQPGERVLDLGCGDGALTVSLREAGAQVVGLDRSPEMVQAARTRGLDVREGSAEALEFREQFDAVFSNAALHWMPNQSAVLHGIYRALRPGGRFVAELGGHGNIAAIRTALRCLLEPYGVDAEAVGGNRFFTEEAYRSMLREAGFQVESIALIPRPTLLPGGITEWLETFRKSLLDELAPDQKAEVLGQCRNLLDPILGDEQGRIWADYVRLRFRAIRPVR